MNQLIKNNLLGIKELSLEEIELIFETADNFKDVINRPIKKVPSLRDVTIANIFFENSTRTQLSFELAEKIVEKFFTTPFEGGRHERRVAQLAEIEQQEGVR